MLQSEPSQKQPAGGTPGQWLAGREKSQKASNLLQVHWATLKARPQKGSQARPGLSPHSYRERQQEGFELQQKAKEVASSEARLRLPAKNKGGRPKKRKSKAEAQADFRKKRADLTAKARLAQPAFRKAQAARSEEQL